MRRLQKAYRPGTQELAITDEDIDQIQRYAFDYEPCLGIGCRGASKV
jgi:hypothetical protein